MKIVDLSTDIAGRFAAKLFAMSGSTVWRPQGSEAAVATPLSTYLDWGKTRVREDDLGPFLAQADLTFTSFDRGVFQGLALERDRLPTGRVEVTTSSFGMTGPYAAYRGGSLADWASGGYLAITGEPGREPLIGPETLCAYVAGYAAAQGAEAALRARVEGGGGRHVDISVMDVMLGLHQSTFSRASVGFVRQRTGRYAEVYPLTVLSCRDGYVSLGAVSDEEFDRLAIAFGLPDLLADTRFADRAARLANSDALDQKLARYLNDHAADEVVAALQASGVAATGVATPRQVVANPQLASRRFWAVPDAFPGAVMPGNPIPAAIKIPLSTSASGVQPADRLRHADRGDLPLAGITVLDLTAFWAGPSATRCLADLGADVIWVERPRSRQDFEDRTAEPQMLMHQLYHEKMNRHKRSIVLDLESPAGREVAVRLAARADVIVENFRPGVAARLGMGPQALCAEFPRLVYVSLSGFGSAGPWGDWRSFGPNIEAASSIMARTGYAGEAPMRLGHALPDGVGGLAGAFAALRGLRERDETGRGGWFDISQLEVYAALSGEGVLEAAATGTDFPRIGNRSRSGAIQGVFACRGDDEWIALRLDDEADIARFAELAGIDDRPVSLSAWEEVIATYSVGNEKRELAVTLQAAGIEAFPVLKPNEYAGDPHVAARGSFVRMKRDGHDCVLPASPLRSAPPLTNSTGRAPRFGEHGAAIMAELGLSPLDT